MLGSPRLPYVIISLLFALRVTAPAFGVLRAALLRSLLKLNEVRSEYCECYTDTLQI